MKKIDLFKCLALFLLIIIFFNLCSCKKNKREGLENEDNSPPNPKLEPTPTSPETAKVSSEFPNSELQCYLKQCDPSNPQNWCNDDNRFIKAEWCNKAQDRCESDCNGIWVPSKKPILAASQPAPAAQTIPAEPKPAEPKPAEPKETPAPKPDPPPPPRPIIQKVIRKVVKKVDKCSPLGGTCGGKNWFGPFCCSEGICSKHDDFYSQCIQKDN